MIYLSIIFNIGAHLPISISKGNIPSLCWARRTGEIWITHSLDICRHKTRTFVIKCTLIRKVSYIRTWKTKIYWSDLDPTPLFGAYPVSVYKHAYVQLCMCVYIYRERVRERCFSDLKLYFHYFYYPSLYICSNMQSQRFSTQLYFFLQMLV